ncbi:MAG: pyridoxal phosphate-dependent aminotransferase [bacterium]|nr:pyridoxal phosphate-dependent aminotransferase [bacterium]
MNLASRVKEISPSPTLAITAKAKKMRAEGIDVIGFGAGEPDFDTPENVKQAAKVAIDQGFTKYTAESGIDELKVAVVKKLSRDNGLTYEPDEVIISCGAKHSLFNICLALFDPGDEVIVPSPYWVSYPEQIKLVGAKPLIMETRESEEFQIDPDRLSRMITSRTKAIIINSPSNPTGVICSKEVLEKVAEVALSYGIWIISDECYEQITYDCGRFVSIASLGAEIKALTVVVNAVSKPYSMTGWRIGYAAGPKDLIKAMSKIQSQTTSNPTSISQKAAVEALVGDQTFVRKMVAEFAQRKDYMVGRLNKIPGLFCLNPGGAFYAFPNISAYLGKRAGEVTIKSSLDLSNYLLEKAFVAVVPGSAFGSDQHIRLSYACSMENIRRGLDRIEEALSQLSA